MTSQANRCATAPGRAAAHSAGRFFQRGTSRPTSATSAPRRANSTAIARPMPRLAPVTSATLSVELHRCAIPRRPHLPRMPAQLLAAAHAGISLTTSTGGAFGQALHQRSEHARSRRTRRRRSRSYESSVRRLSCQRTSSAIERDEIVLDRRDVAVRAARRRSRSRRTAASRTRAVSTAPAKRSMRRLHEFAVPCARDVERHDAFRAGREHRVAGGLHRVQIAADHDLRRRVEIRELHAARRSRSRTRSATARIALRIQAEHRRHSRRPPARRRPASPAPRSFTMRSASSNARANPRRTRLQNSPNECPALTTGRSLPPTAL